MFGKKKDKDKAERDLSFEKMPHLLKIKPKEKYVFKSDYFEVDNRVACIMSFFHTQGATDNYGPFWGINRIPNGLDENIVTVNFEQVCRMGESWIAAHQNTAEGISKMNENSQDQGGTNSSRNKARRSRDDLETIAQELNDGASYLNVHNRILVKAPDLESLDKAVARIERLYLDRFATLRAAPYIGMQRTELSRLFAKNELKKGKGFYFTSNEYAGSYSLVTHGLEDPAGIYVGYMVGDVNNSAVLFDVNNYRHHIVVANEAYDESHNRAHMADIWGSKISQSCLMGNNRVIHLVLDTCDLDTIGPKFESITSKIDMNTGDLNMFEMFGEEKDELAIFPSQMQKLILMAEQAYETTDSDRSIIRGSLEEVATKFYIEQRMWYENAIVNRDRLRVVGIPHKDVPKLEVFVSYLDLEYKRLVHSDAQDSERLHAISILATTFRNLLSNNGDLFNTTTTDAIDLAKDGRRVIYDFSGLMRRGKGVAMAQLVNVIGFAIGNLGYGDTVIIHGSEHIDKGIRDYVNTQFDALWAKGGRVVYLYNNFEKMFNDQEFNHFDKADYSVLGCMTQNIVDAYQKRLGQSIPEDLVKLIVNKSPSLCYIRRGFDNVVFHQDLRVDLS